MESINEGNNNSKCFFMCAIQEECDLKLIRQLVNDKNLSRIYGFILYTDKDLYVCKMLSDKLYWEELDKKSGSRWPIFTVRQLEKGYDEYIGASPNGAGFMLRKWHEPPMNMDVLENFDIDSTEDLPLFVAFIWDNSGTVQSVSVNINGRSDSEVYNKVEEVVSAIARAEEAVLPQYRQNEELFRNVKSELDAINFRYTAKAVFKKAMKFIPLFKLLM